jgi:hypothetical protein
MSNLALLVSAVLQFLTTAVMAFHISPLEGPVVYRMHALNGFLLFALMALHLALHGAYFRGLFARRR